MKKKAKIKTCIAFLCLLCGIARADSGWGDSLAFLLNTLTLYDNGGIGMADSPEFSINLCPVARACADSDSFSFDWLAYSQPMMGPTRPPIPLPDDDLLEQYDSVNNRWFSPFVSCPSAGQPVIVLNHGWNSKPNSLLGLAGAISNRIPGIHIYTWHWGNGPDIVSDANPNGISTKLDFDLLGECLFSLNLKDVMKCLFSNGWFRDELIKTKTNAALHGGRLGDSLLAHGIRPDLHKIHLIGSSYGGVVCAEAAKTLAKYGAKVQQITTLDTPSLYVNAVEEYIKPESAERVEVLYYDWHTCLVRGGTGGPVKTNASNILNLKLNSLFYPECTPWNPLHFKVSDWYAESADASALNCENDPYGFGWSASLNPTSWHWNDWPLGSEHETMGGKGCLTPLGELIAEDIVATIKELDKFDSAATWFGNKAQVVIDKTKDSVSSVMLYFQDRLPQSQGEYFAFSGMDLPSDSNDAYIYKEVNVPPGTDEIAFDVRFSAVGEGDKLTLSVGDEILIVIDACAVGVSDTYQTYYASVSDYAGQTVTLQIALRALGTAQTVALVDNLRFTSLTLVEDITGDRAVNEADLEVLIKNWLVVGCDFREHCDGADINRDNKVDFADFSRLATYWFESF